MTDPVSGQTIICVFLGRIKLENVSEEFLKQQFRRFQKELYSFCYECWVGAMMNGAQAMGIPKQKIGL